MSSNVLQCTELSPTMKSHPAPNGGGAEVKNFGIKVKSLALHFAFLFCCYWLLGLTSLGISFSTVKLIK